jgi:hypothetical protein
MSCPPVRTRFAQNISWDISGNYFPGGTGVGWWISGQIGAEDVIIDHNTDIGRSGGKPVMWDLPEFNIEGVKITNNISMVDPTYGGFEYANVVTTPDPCVGLTGAATMNCRFKPSYIFTNNALLPFNGSTQSQINSFFPPPLSNFVPASGALNLQGFFQAQSAYSMSTADPDLHLLGSSSWCSGCHSRANDGMDEGANIDLILATQGKVIFISANSTGIGLASVTVVQPDSGTCTLDYGTEPTVTTFTRVSLPCTPGPVTFNLTGLARAIPYYFRYDGAVQSPIGHFRTN